MLDHVFDIMKYAALQITGNNGKKTYAPPYIVKGTSMGNLQSLSCRTDGFVCPFEGHPPC